MNINHQEIIPAVTERQVSHATSPEARKVLTLGREHGWNFHVLGQAEMPTESVRIGEWMIVPALEDSSPIPRRTYERIQALYAGGIRPKGFVVVHEAPKLLVAPQGDKQQPGKHERWWERVKANLSPARAAVGIAALGTAAIASAAIMVVILTAVIAAIAIPVLLVGAVAIDPIVVAVMEDNSWIEIDRWAVEAQPG